MARRDAIEGNSDSDDDLGNTYVNGIAESSSPCNSFPLRHNTVDGESSHSQVHEAAGPLTPFIFGGKEWEKIIECLVANSPEEQERKTFILQTVADKFGIKGSSKWETTVVEVVLKRFIDEHTLDFGSFTDDKIKDIFSAYLVYFEGKAEWALEQVVIPQPSMGDLTVEMLFSWKVQRLLLQTNFHGTPVFTHGHNVTAETIFRHFITTDFILAPEVDLNLLYKSHPYLEGVCMIVLVQFNEMITKLTKCGILPTVLRDEEILYLRDNPKDVALLHFEQKSKWLETDEATRIDCQEESHHQINKFWATLLDIYSWDKKHIDLKWEAATPKSVFMLHYSQLRTTIPVGSSSADSEWNSLLLRQKQVKAKSEAKKGKEKVNTGKEAMSAEQEARMKQGRDDMKVQMKRYDEWSHFIEIRKSYYKVSVYENRARQQRRFLKNLFKFRSLEQAPHFHSLSQQKNLDPSYLSGEMLPTQLAIEKTIEMKAKLLKDSLVQLQFWGAGPFDYLKQKNMS